MTKNKTDYNVFFRFTCIFLIILLFISISPENVRAAGETDIREQSSPAEKKNMIIPEKVIFYSGHTYALYQIPDLDWPGQKAFCERLGTAAGVKAYLSVITTSGENEAVRTMKPYASIGAYESGGVWKWVDGTPLGRQVPALNSRGDPDFLYIPQGYDDWCKTVHGLPHSGQQQQEPDSFVPYIGQCYANFNADYGWHNLSDTAGSQFICEFDARVNFIYAEMNTDFDFSIRPWQDSRDLYPYTPGCYTDIGEYTVVKPLKSLPASLEKEPEGVAPVHPDKKWSFAGWSYKSDAGKNELFGYSTGGEKQLVWDYKSRDPLKICESEPVLVMHAVWEDGNITLNKKAATILIDQSLTLTATVDTKSAYTVTWFSGDSTIAMVDRYGKVTGIKPGMTTVTARTNRGKTSQCRIIVFHMDTGSFNFGASFDDNVKGPAIRFLDNEFPLFDMNIGVKLELQYLELNYDEEEDKILVKIGKSADVGGESAGKNGGKAGDPYWKQEYADIKKMAKMVGVETDKEFYDSFRKFRSNLKKYKTKLGVDCEAAVYGYLEFDTAAGEPSFSEGGLVVSWESDVNVSARPIAAFPPLYVKFGFEVGADGKLVLKPKASNAYSPKYNVSGEADFAIAPYIAAGMELLGDKVYMEAGAKMTFDNKVLIGAAAPGECYTLTGQGSVYLEYRALAFSERFSKHFTKYQLYPKPKSGEKLTSILFSPDTGTLMPSLRTAQVSPLKGSTFAFANDPVFDLMPLAGISTGRFLAGSAEDPAVSVPGRRFAFVADTPQESNAANVVKQNVYDHGEPSIVSLGDGRYLMVWVDDDASRNDINRTSLMYSLNSDGAWSAPLQVSDDGTADFSPELFSVGSDTYLIWQNAGRKFGGGIRFEDMAGSMDISFAKFNGSSMKFTDIRNITAMNSNIFEMSPAMAGDENTISVYWTENNKNDPLNLSNTNKICRISWSKGKWGAKETVKSGLSYIGGISAVYEGGREVLSYIALGKSSPTNPELHIIRKGKDSRISGAVTPSDVRIQGGKLYWRDGSTIKQVDINDSANKVKDLGIQLSPDARDMKMTFDISGKAYITWLSNVDYENELFLSSYVPGREIRSEGVQVTQNRKAVRDYAILPAVQDKLVLVRNLSEIRNTGPGNPMPFGRTDLTVDFLRAGSDSMNER